MEMNKVFGEVIKRRRDHPNECSEDDILNVLVSTTYK